MMGTRRGLSLTQPRRAAGGRKLSNGREVRRGGSFWPQREGRRVVATAEVRLHDPRQCRAHGPQPDGALAGTHGVSAQRRHETHLSPRGTFTKTGHTPGHTMNLNQPLKAEITPKTLSDGKCIQLEISNSKATGKTFKHLDIRNLSHQRSLGTAHRRRQSPALGVGPSPRAPPRSPSAQGATAVCSSRTRRQLGRSCDPRGVVPLLQQVALSPVGTATSPAAGGGQTSCGSSPQRGGRVTSRAQW